MFAIDAVSRQNFYRTLQKTRSYIENRGWLPLEGYNKVGEDTLANVIPMFTGMSEQQLRQNCWPNNRHSFDNCPFIWKKFADKGYLTSYSEDQLRGGTFNWKSYGFTNSPTNYYNRPIARFGEDFLRKKVSTYLFYQCPATRYEYKRDCDH